MAEAKFGGEWVEADGYIWPLDKSKHLISIICKFDETVLEGEAFGSTMAIQSHIVDCHNACQGMTDPKAEIEELRRKATAWDIFMRYGGWSIDYEEDTDGKVIFYLTTEGFSDEFKDNTKHARFTAWGFRRENDRFTDIIDAAKELGIPEARDLL